MAEQPSNPADRRHFWERPTPDHERPAEPVNPHFPRHVHKAGGEFKEVTDDREFRDALADGWRRDPVPPDPAA